MGVFCGLLDKVLQTLQLFLAPALEVGPGESMRLLNDVELDFGCGLAVTSNRCPCPGESEETEEGEDSYLILEGIVS